MPEYRRIFIPGGTYFLTLVTDGRRPVFAVEWARRVLHESFVACRSSRPFEIDGIVLLPDHLHLVMTLPEGDEDFSRRIAAIKASFTHEYLCAGGHERPRNDSKASRRERGVWQRRFWEHRIRDMEDLNNHLDYIHYNPVKHGLVACPHAWPHSSFQRWVDKQGYQSTWLCSCASGVVTPPRFETLNQTAME